jgi:hypothetical protein
MEKISFFFYLFHFQLRFVFVCFSLFSSLFLFIIYFLRQTSKMPSFSHLYTQMPSFPLFHQNAIGGRMDKLVGSGEQHQWVTVGAHEIKLNKKIILKQVT